MRRVVRSLLTSLAIACASLSAGGVAVADPIAQLHPIHLRVAGGEDAWHADNDFRLDWDSPPVAEQALPVQAIHFQVRDRAGNVVLPATRLPWAIGPIEFIHVPAGPGRYAADVWLEGPGGATGPPVSVALLFDNTRPGPVKPLLPAGWVAGSAAAIVRIEHPPVPLPISGLRGYAVSVDRGGGGAPCEGGDRCSTEETDLSEGVGGDTISLGRLPEGINVVRAVAVSNAGMRSAVVGSAVVRVDATRPEVSLKGVAREWASGPVRLAAEATDGLSGMAADGPAGPYTAIAVDGGVPRTAPGGTVATTVTGEGTHSIALYARDAAGNVGAESPAGATVRIDEGAPVVTFARSQDRSEPERMEATVADALSGPDRGRGSIAVRPAGSRQRFEPLPTAVSGTGRLVARWDSDTFPPGTYEFRATGYDAAGNASNSERRDDGTRMVLPNPLKGSTAIEAGFGGRRLVWQRCRREARGRRCRRRATEAFEARPSTRTVPYGRGISFGGRLTSAAGAPLGGLPVEVVETFAGGAVQSRHTTTVRTANDGTFVARLSPGPCRQVEAVFAGSPNLTRVAGGRVQLEVQAGVRLRASTASARVGGPPVVFSGRLGDLGAAIPVGGLPVELQFKLPGSDWAEFRTVQTDARGRFRYAYAFSDDDSRGVRFQFRAYAPAGDAWPYEPAASRPVTVLGR